MTRPKQYAHCCTAHAQGSWHPFTTNDGINWDGSRSKAYMHEVSAAQQCLPAGHPFSSFALSDPCWTQRGAWHDLCMQAVQGIGHLLRSPSLFEEFSSWGDRQGCAPGDGNSKWAGLARQAVCGSVLARAAEREGGCKVLSVRSRTGWLVSTGA